MRSVNPAVLAMRTSGIRRIHDLVRDRAGIIDLTIGEPDLPTPAHIVEAACKALMDGATGYTPIAGYQSLRELLSEKLQRVNGLEVDPANIIVSVGAMSGLMAALMTLVQAGDGVLIPDPGWTGYFMLVENLGAEVIGYKLTETFQPDLDHVERLARRPNAKVLIINSPGNPTGAVFSEATMRALVDIAERNDLYILSDEAYDELTFAGGHVGPAATGAGAHERVVSAFSFSKTYSMTGFRVGYVVADPELVKSMVRVQENLVGCAPAPSQRAAEAALTGPQDSVAHAVEVYSRRRDVLIEALNDSPLSVVPPQGALYGFLDARGLPGDTSTLAERLVTEAGVALAPGDSFGPAGAGFLRLCLTVDEDALREAVQRINAALQPA